MVLIYTKEIPTHAGIRTSVYKEMSQNSVQSMPLTKQFRGDNKLPCDHSLLNAEFKLNNFFYLPPKTDPGQKNQPHFPQWEVPELGHHPEVWKCTLAVFSCTLQDNKRATSWISNSVKFIFSLQNHFPCSPGSQLHPLMAPFFLYEQQSNFFPAL